MSDLAECASWSQNFDAAKNDHVLTGRIRSFLGALNKDAEEQQHKKEKDPRHLVSVEHHVHVQILLECLLWWGILPYFWKQGVFGTSISDGKNVAETLLSSRRKLTSLQIPQACLQDGFDSFEENNSRLNFDLAKACAEFIWSVSQFELYAYIVGDRYLPDLCLYWTATGAAMKEIPTIRAKIGSLLQALHLQAQCAIALGTKEVSKLQQETRTVLGRQLNSLAAEKGGVASIILEMLTHVPHGNIRAFQRVSELLLANSPGNQESVVGQIMSLLQESISDCDSKRAYLFQRSCAISVNVALKKSVGTEKVLRPLFRRSFLLDKGDSADEEELRKGIKLLFVLLNAAPPGPEMINATKEYVEKCLQLAVFCASHKLRLEGESREVVFLWLNFAPATSCAKFLRRSAAILSSDVSKFTWSSSHRLIDGPAIGTFDLTLLQCEENQKIRDVEKEHTDEASAVEIIVGLLERISEKRRAILSLLFSQSLAGLGALLSSCEQGEFSSQTATDLAILKNLMESKTFELSHEYVDPKEVVEGLRKLLESCASVLNVWTYEVDGDGQPSSVLSTALALEICGILLSVAATLSSPILNSGIVLGEDLQMEEFWPSKSGKSRFSTLKQLVPVLMALSRLRADKFNEAQQLQQLCQTIAETAMSVHVEILTSNVRRPKYAVRKLDSDVLDPVGTSIIKGIQLLKSKEPPDRAMGIDKLRAILAGALKPGDDHFESIVENLLEALLDEDSYVYLTSVRCISFACDRHPREMIPRLVKAYTGENDSGRLFPTTARIRLGEAIMLAARRAGETLPFYAPPLLTAFAAQANVHKAITKSRVDDQGRLVQSEDDQSTDEVDAMLRVSNTSNLAEICGLAPWAAFRYANTLVRLAKGTLACEKETVSLRRASAFFLLKIIEGALTLKDMAGMEEIPEALKEIHQLINASSTYDEDAVVRLHCDRARARFDELMRQYFEPAFSEDKVLRVSLHLDKI